MSASPHLSHGITIPPVSPREINESVHTQQLQDGNCYLNAVMMMNITIVAKSANAMQDQRICSV